MKKLLMLVLIFLALAVPSADAARGTVTLVSDDKIVVRAEGFVEQYTLADVWGSVWGFESGDEIIGVEDMYGSQTWYNRDRDCEFDVYVEDYWASAEKAMEYFSK